VQINGEVIAVSAGSVTLDAGSTFDRYDLVSVNASGSKIVTKGTTKRKCPTQPANTCLLAIVFVPAGATVIATGDVYDARLLASKVVTDTLHTSGVIVNHGYITATKIRPEASDEVRWTKTGTGDSNQAEITHTVTIPAVYTPGTAKIIANVAFYWSGETGMGGYVRVRVNGVQVYSRVANGTHEATISIQGGDLVSITARSLRSMSIALSDTIPVVYPGAPTWPE